jgi:hypothetical protein
MAKRKGSDDTGSPEGTPPGGGKSGPAHEIRIGRVRCMIWENRSPEQETWYSLTFSRVYTDGGSKEKSAQSFGRDDLLVLAEVARQAFLWVARQQGGSGFDEPPSA